MIRSLDMKWAVNFSADRIRVMASNYLLSNIDTSSGRLHSMHGAVVFLERVTTDVKRLGWL